jgi:hypothetical protein
MNRSIRAHRLGATIALLGFLSVARSLEAATLINCAPVGAGTDLISRAFYIPNYPGVSLRDLTMSVSSDTAGRYVLTLTAHLDRFDGPVLGSSTSGISLTGDATAPVAITFSFASPSALPVPKGHTIAFVVNRQGSGSENLSFATAASGACAAVETNDSTPPLSTVKGSVPVTVTGDAAPGGPIANSTFDTDVSGWAVSASGGAGTLAFDSADADGATTSGSAAVTNSGTAAVSVAKVQGCVPNAHPGTYTYGGKVRVASGQSAPGAADYVVGAYSTTDCSGSDLLIYDQTPFVTADDVWHATSSTWVLPTGTNRRSIALFLAVEKDSASGTLKANFDDAFVRSTQTSTLTVLGAASIHGQAGAFFHTDLWVFNRSYAETINVTAQFRCFAGRDCGLGTASFDIAPRQQVLYQDVLKSLLKANETAGTLELSWDSSFGAISASARTYSPSAPTPTNGTGIPALGSTESRGRALFTGLASNGGDLSAGFRSNVGAYNPSSTPANVTLTLFDDSGVLLGGASHAFAGFEAFQFNDIFAVVGKGTTLAQKATLVLTSDVPVFSYVTVIDNQTNDSSFVLPANDEGQP